VAARAPVLAAALVVAAVAGFTGWVGGEVLVFHAGMAVRAAGDGALAPPTSSRTTARDFLDAMRQVRARWAAIETHLAWMLVHQPRDAEFAAVEDDARQMAVLARAMADFGAREPRHGDTLASMAQTLAGDADDLADAAKKKSLQDLATALGETSGHCADCHEETRWK
jgi:cytochrome c556